MHLYTFLSTADTFSLWGQISFLSNKRRGFSVESYIE